MDRFTGNIDAKVDVKGRVFVPAAFRKILQKSEDMHLVIRKDIYKECLILYTRTSWEEEMDRVRLKLNRYNEDHQQFFRQFLMDTETLEMDSMGRILIPKKYLHKISVAKDVKFLGMDDNIEIWCPSLLDSSLIDNETFKEKARQFLGES